MLNFIGGWFSYQIEAVSECFNLFDGYFGTFCHQSSFGVSKIVGGQQNLSGRYKDFRIMIKYFGGQQKMFWRAANKFTWEQWGRQKLRGVVEEEAIRQG